MNPVEIEKRYTQLAESSCCMSCGDAIDFSNPSEGEVCLDLGCGRGNDVLKMAGKVGPRGRVYGVDITEGMLEKARRTAEKISAGNVEFIRADLEKIPLPDQSVDLVISNCTINHVSDKKSTWKEIYRILKDGGRFVVSDIYAREPVPEEYRNDPVAVAECWAGADTRHVYLQTLKNAGFQKIDILEESTPYEKGRITVSSFTLTGKKVKTCCCS